MSWSTASHRAKEQAKLGGRLLAGRAGLSLGRDPFSARLARTLATRDLVSVLDIGANVGQYARLLRGAGFSGSIVSVEPLDEAFAQLDRTAAKDPHWSAMQVAVGETAGEAEINVSANSYSSSLLPMTQTHLDAAPPSRVVGAQHVRVTTVDELVDRFALQPERTLLKVDTQGFEGPVLRGARDTLPRLGALQLELSFVELYEGQRLYDDLVAELRDGGMVLWSMEPGIADAAGRLLQCDAVFVREARA